MNRRVDNIIADLQKFLEQTRAAGYDRVYLDAKRILESREGFDVESHDVASPPPPADANVVADGAKAERKRASKSGASKSGASKSGAAKSGPATSVAATADAAEARPADAASDAAVEPEPLEPPVVLRDDKRQAAASAALKTFDEGEVRDCTRCGLHSTRTQTVFGVGNPDADLVFVGEAPGRDEDRQGEPFVGAAGQLLTRIIGAIGFERDDVYICNVLKCRPPNNRDPQPMEVASCEPYLLKQLDILKPKLICALGRHAAHTLLGKSDSLKRMRESVHDYHGIPTMVTYHPAALLRNPQWKRPTWEDVQKLRALYDQLAAGD